MSRMHQATITAQTVNNGIDVVCCKIIWQYNISPSLSRMHGG